MPRPNFFIVGAPKCGTTSMYEYLASHPSVFVPRLKEPHYFAADLPGRRIVQTEDDYLALFAGADERHLAIGEASTWYLFSQEAPSRILRFCREARLVVFLRNPVDFVQSLHDQFSYDQGRSPDFPMAWRDHSAEFIEYGSFGIQLERLLRVCPRAQLLVVLFDDLVTDPQLEYRRVLRHIGLTDDGRREFPAYNVRKFHRSNWLADFIVHTPYPVVRGWLEFKKRTGAPDVHVLDWLSRLNIKPAPKRAIEPQLRREVHEAFTSDIEVLADIMHRDLSHWA